MKILFVMNTPGFLRYFDATVHALLERGHEVTLAFTRPDMRPESLVTLDGAPAGLTVLEDAAPRREDRYATAAETVRAVMDFVRYLDPGYAGAEFLRNRRRVRVLQLAPALRPLAWRTTLPAHRVRRLLDGLLAAERAIPSAPEIERFIQDHQPDVVLVSPLVTGASPQTDYVKAAHALGIPSGVCVASWDNLTNKGLLRVLPDRVIVWNDAQRIEAQELHGAPPESVVVTGAQPFDRWFGRSPSTSREDFCRKTGLDPAQPFVLFTGSTSNIAKEGVEESWVVEWIRALRESDDADAARAGVMVRPHPDRPGRWDAGALEEFDNVTLWPPVRPNSVSRESRTDYFDSLHHAAAVVGINTSAMVEAAAIGRPVLTVRAPEFVEAQAGTPHFLHLLADHGGPALEAATMAEHAAHVGAALRDPGSARERNERFVRSFIRPHGVDADCTPILVEAIEELGSLRAAPPARGSRLLRAGLLALGVPQRALERRRDPKRTRRLWKRRVQAVRRLGEGRPLPLRAAASALALLVGLAGRWRTFAAGRARNRMQRRAAEVKRRAAELTGAAGHAQGAAHRPGAVPAAPAAEEVRR